MNTLNCRVLVSSAGRVGAGIAAWLVLCASPAQAAIVEISGAAELVVDYSINYDYNRNDIVDAADYVVWRNSLGPGSLPNEGGITPGFVNQFDYNSWRSRFGSNTFYTHKVTTEAEQNSRRSVLLQAFNERPNVTLIATIQTNNPPFEQVLLPGNSPIGWEKPGPPIPTGQVVNSHYIWLNAPCDAQQGCDIKHDIATFKFDGPIIGLIGGPVELNASNGPLGFDFVSYTPTVTNFVNESYPNNPTGDPPYVPISGDIVTRLAPAVLKVDFTGIAGDYVRVVTAANIPLHAGDFDHDYDVDNSDFAIWRATFGMINDLRADANGNAVVDAADYIEWRKNLGYSYTFPGAGNGSGAEQQQGAAVPEPRGGVIMVLCALCGVLPRPGRRGGSDS